MMYRSAIVGAFALQASAFPFVLNEVVGNAASQGLSERANGGNAAVAASKARKNCGVVPCVTFNAEEQYVSTTGEYAYASPAADEIRGPCPGLNAAANHGYLPRSGVPTITDTITGLGKAYGMSVDLAGVLAAIAVLLDGDPVTQTWSIGGPPPSDQITSGLLGQPQGISYSHDKYENDASIGRADAYLNNGDAHSLIVSRFVSAYKAHNGDGLYTLDHFARNYGKKAEESVQNNPYAFWGPFSGLVAPAAYNFVINFMSNHTAENPNGYLNGAMFKTFFAVEGDKPADFKWLPGQERIPENWYKRPSDNEYNAVNVFQDLGAQFLAYPSTFYLGGNTGKVNTFTGVNLGNLTGGAYEASTLFQGNNLGCFFFQAVEAGFPDAASLPTQKANALTSILNQFVTPVTGNLSCPQLGKYEQGLFNKFPGYKYHPTGPATNY